MTEIVVFESNQVRQKAELEAGILSSVKKNAL